ncbi:MAG: GTP 3',8-cyclase MoaA [Treponema sp.]|nr:GTP 3',8-cyclase MoaA [Treponema sp.]
MSQTMVDGHGRVIDYLRVSVTDRCNLRCLYCMPEDGVPHIPRREVLSFEEVLRLCRIFAELGIKTVRITGGEPLVRRDVVGFVRSLKRIPGITRVSMTTNGVFLGKHLQSLADSGLDAVNVSLDTLDDEVFARLSRGKDIGNILSAIDRAYDLGLVVKINCVPVKGFNEGEIVRLAALAKDRRIYVRFIELMPIGVAASLAPVSLPEITAALEAEFGPLEPSAIKPGDGPAAYRTPAGFAGSIGLIGALSSCYCQTCNRLRLTSAGQLQPCLAGTMGADLRELLRGEAGDGRIVDAILGLIANKPAEHDFCDADGDPGHRKKEMFRIGG